MTGIVRITAPTNANCGGQQWEDIALLYFLFISKTGDMRGKDDSHYTQWREGSNGSAKKANLEGFDMKVVRRVRVQNVLFNITEEGCVGKVRSLKYDV